MFKGIRRERANRINESKAAVCPGAFLYPHEVLGQPSLLERAADNLAQVVPMYVPS